MKKIITLFFTAFTIQMANAQNQFADQTATIASGLPQVDGGFTSFADVDNDGDLDLLISGEGACQLWENNTVPGSSATFSPSSLMSLPSVYSPGGVSWADYDNDGDLDLLLCVSGATQIQQNGTTGTTGAFTNIASTIAPGVPGLYSAAASWVDIDNDGDLDFMIAGDQCWYGCGPRIAMIWQNGTTGTSGTFTDQTATFFPSIVGYIGATIDWADFDNDGDKDLLYAGTNSSNDPVSQIWRNGTVGAPGAFTNVTSSVAPGFSQAYGGTVRWEDLNNDGSLDIYESGYPASGVVWMNTGLGTFTNQTSSVVPGMSIAQGSYSAFGDADNNGSLDLLASDPYSYVQLWTSAGSPPVMSNKTTELISGNTSFGAGGVAWADIDNDHDLDFIATGYYYDGSTHSYSRIWQNGIATPNTPPTTPSGLQALGGDADGDVILTWTASTDNTTASRALSYNVRIGTAPGLSDVVSPNSDLATGFNRVADRGNVSSGTNFFLNGLTPGTPYYWSVQAIDNSYEGGAFSSEQSFTVKSVQHITTSGDLAATYGDADVDPNASSDNSSIAITYTSSNTSVATIVAGKLHITGTGAATITAGQAEDATYMAASSSFTFTVAKATATITLPSLSNATYGDADIDPQATSTNEDTDITYESDNTDVATIVSGKIHIVGAGSATITANQAEDDNHLAATASGSFTVDKATPTITLPSLDDATYGDTDIDPQATSTNEDTGISYESDNTDVATIVSGKIHIVGVGSATITATQAEDDNHLAATASTSFTVDKATPVITFPTLTSMTVSDADVDPNATSTNTDTEIVYESSDLDVVTIIGGQIHAVAEGTATITASQDGDDNYNDATPVSRTITVTALTGVQSSLSTAMRFYPNPAKDQVTVEVTGITLTNEIVSLCDLMGKQISTAPTQQDGAMLKASFSVSDLPEGIYIVNIQSDQGMLSRQVEKR